MPNNGAYNNQAASPAQRNIGPVGLTRAAVTGAPPSGQWLFEDTFDAQADWVADRSNGPTAFSWSGGILPTGWNASYDSGGAFSAHPNIEITSSTLDGSGKALRVWRENVVTNPAYHSNGVLGKLFDQDYDELYVEFEIAFQDGWTSADGATATSKVFRVFSSSRDQIDFWQAFANGEQGPLTLWDYEVSGSYGLRNTILFRGGPHGENYAMSDADIGNIGRSIVSGSQGDISMNWTQNMQGNLTGGGSPQIPDKLNGGFLPTTGNVTHEQVYGPAGTFTKIGIYVKMNSAPGVADGIYREYLDGQLIVDSETVRWVDTTASPMPGWNAFSLGGNDDWAGGMWSDTDQREEYYEIRRVAVYPGPPEEIV